MGKKKNLVAAGVNIKNNIYILNTAYLSFERLDAETHFESILSVPIGVEACYNERRNLIGAYLERKKVPPLTDDGMIDGKPQEDDHGKDDYRFKVFCGNIKHLETKIGYKIDILGYLKGEFKNGIYFNTLVKIRIGEKIIIEKAE